MTRTFTKFIPCLLGFAFLLLFSCEKEEKILLYEEPDYCPVKFRYKPNLSFNAECAPIPDLAHLPQFRNDDTGVVVRQLLHQRSSPYFSWVDSLDRETAYNIVDSSSLAVLEFDKIELDTGALVSLFFNIYYQSGQSTAEDKVWYEDSPWVYKVWIRRAANGQYETGATALFQEYVFGTGIPEFASATLSMQSENGHLHFTIRLFEQPGLKKPIAEWTLAEPFEQSAAPYNKYFAGTGMELTDEEENKCGAHPVELRFLRYYFKNSTGYERSDNFECNSFQIRF